MSWTTIRPATPEDHDLLEQRAAAFVKRHNLYPAGETAVDTIEIELLGLEPSDRARLERLWHRVASRALRHPHATGIAYGHVGHHTD